MSTFGAPSCYVVVWKAHVGEHTDYSNYRMLSTDVSPISSLIYTFFYIIRSISFRLV